MSILAVSLAACGTGDDTTEGTLDQSEELEGDDYVTEHDLTFTLDVKEDENSLQFTMTLENESDEPKQVEFSSGQKFDITVKDERGNTVYHFAEGKMFTQAIISETIEPGQSLTLEDTWDAGKDLSEKHLDIEAVLMVYAINNEEIDKGTFKVSKSVSGK